MFKIDLIIIATISVVLIIVAFFVGITYRKNIAEAKLGKAEKRASEVIDDAIKEAKSEKKEILLEAKEESLKIKNKTDKEIKERREELQSLENRLNKKEDNLEKRITNLEKREDNLLTKTEEFEKKEKEVNAKNEKIIQELEKVSGYTSDEAKQQLLNNLEAEIEQESATIIREKEKEAKDEASKKAKEIIVNAIQKSAAEHVTDTTVSVVNLPNEEMKGRIIGREGRNIRAFEKLTGIEIIIDDTPEAVVLSGFNAVRREIARVALEKLIEDGRIHPARIEEIVNKAQREVEERMREIGKKAAFDTGVHGLDGDTYKLLGRLKHRTSYGQNVLQHSIEVANLCAIIAAELELDSKLAKRAGFLHDIGKALDHENEGTHIELGVKFLKKHGEKDKILNAVEAHHGDTEAQTLIAVIVQAADAISAARPGARRETMESYIERLKDLEKISGSFDGVEKAYAIQAGREIRVMVTPDVISDDKSVILARKIAKKIENELEYPGQVKVNIIRETRAVDYAK